MKRKKRNQKFNTRQHSLPPWTPMTSQGAPVLGKLPTGCELADRVLVAWVLVMWV